MRPCQPLYRAAMLSMAIGAACHAAPALAFPGDPPAPRRYANPTMLVETGWLAGHLKDAGVRIVDMRDAAAYAAGHVPGAAQVDETGLRDPADPLDYLPSAAAFAALMERAGIGDATRVVAYDDQGGRMAARLWYVLNAYGHRSVSLLNGGWVKWVSEGREASREPAPAVSARFTARPMEGLTCPATEVLARKRGFVVLDVRSPDEYSGAALSPKSARAGHIPGAVNVDWHDNVEGASMTFKPAGRLIDMYAAKGITRDKQIVTQCATGGRAAQTLFTLKLLGFPKVRIYYGSFSDYSGHPDAPVDKQSP